MTSPALPRFDRAGFATLASATSALLLLVAVAPRNERALFLRDGRQPAAKAFLAVVPPLDPVRAQVERRLFDAISWRSGRAASGRPNAQGQQFGPTNQSLPPEALPGLLSSGTGPGAGPASQGGTSISAPATALTLAGGDQPPGATGGIGAGPGAPGLPNPIAGGVTVPVVVAAVPEPSTWATMLLGFFVIGVAARRRSPTIRQKRATIA